MASVNEQIYKILINLLLLLLLNLDNLEIYEGVKYCKRIANLLNAVFVHFAITVVDEMTVTQTSVISDRIRFRINRLNNCLGSSDQ